MRAFFSLFSLFKSITHKKIVWHEMAFNTNTITHDMMHGIPYSSYMVCFYAHIQV